MAKSKNDISHEESIKTTDQNSDVIQPDGRSTARGLYTIEDLMAAESRLEASPAIIATALKKSGKTSFGFDEAKSIVTAFKNKKIGG